MWMMLSPPNNSAINGNRASGNAKLQNTINQNTQHILNLQLPNNLWPAPEIPIEQFRKGQGPQLDRIWGAEVEKYFATKHPGQDHSARDHAHKPRSTKASYCFIRNAAFPELDAFDRTILRNLAQYPDARTTKCVLDILKTSQKHSLSQWANSRRSRALLLDFPSAIRERLHWTTNFSMEVIGRINLSNQTNDAKESKAVVAHFCDATKPWTQQLAVRDFLAQLRRARINVLKTNHVCGGDDNIYHNDTQVTRSLWDLLLYSVKRAGIGELYIIMDNFDSIQSQVGSKAVQEFWGQLWSFAQASQENNVPVKILLTSRSPQKDDSFPDLRRIRLSLDPRERSEFGESPHTPSNVEKDLTRLISSIAVNEPDEATKAVIMENKAPQKANMRNYITNRPLYKIDSDVDSSDTFSKSTITGQITRRASDPAYSDSSASKTNRRVNLVTWEQIREENDSAGNVNSRGDHYDGTWQSSNISSTSQRSTTFTNEEKQNVCARFSRALVESLPLDFHYSVLNESSSAHFVHHLSQAITDFAASSEVSTTSQLHREGVRLVQRVRNQIAHKIDSDIIAIEQSPEAARRNITAFENQSQMNARLETPVWVASSDAFPPLSQMMDEDVVPNQHNIHSDALSQTSEDSSMDGEDEIDVDGRSTNAAIFMKPFSNDAAFDRLAKQTERLLQRYHSSKLDWIRYKTSLCIRRKLSRSVSENVCAVFRIRWSLREFFLDNYDHGLNQKLDTVLAVTGNIGAAWACSIKEYFQWCWPLYGLHLLRAFERQLLPGSVGNDAMKDTAESCPSGSISVAFDLETVWVNGTEEFVICMAQGIAWLVAACQEKRETLSYAYVDFSEVVSANDSTEAIMEVGVKFEEPLPTEVEICWHQLVGPAIIIAGFPIPERMPEQKGLEVSIPTMAALAGIPQAVTFNGGYVFKGRSHAVIPVTNAGDWVQWHLLSVLSGKLRWTDIDKLCSGRIRNHATEVSFLEARAFVGWCPKVNELLGTSAYDYKSMQYSNATMRSRSAHLDNLSFGFSQWGQLVAEVSFGKKDGFRNPISGSQDDFDQLLDDARDIHVILHDTADQRAFQVTGEDYILHVIHQLRATSPKYHTSDKLDFAVPDRSMMPTRQTMLSNADRIVAARTPISQSTTQPQSFKQEVKLIYSTIAGLWAHEYAQGDGISTIGVDLQRGIQGWEHMDIVRKSREMKPKCAPLKTSGQWAKYARDIEALVLFGTGFNDVMRPLAPDSLCADFKTLPVGRSYLAVRTESLRALFDQQGCYTDQSRLTLSGLALQSSSDILMPCHVEKHPEGKECSASRLVRVIKKPKSDHYIIPLQTNGAIIMGVSQDGLLERFRRQARAQMTMSSTIFPFQTSSNTAQSTNQIGEKTCTAVGQPASV